MPKNKLETYYLIAFSILGIFPLVPLIVKPFLLVPLLLVGVLNLLTHNKPKVNWKKVLISTSLYLIFIVSALYTTNFDRAIKLLIRLSPFLVLPIGFAMVPEVLYKKLTDAFVQVYIISCGLFCFIILIYIETLSSTDIYVIYSYLSTQFWGYGDHPIYISLYLGIALILILFKNKKSVFNIFLFVTIVFTLLFLSRKGNILGLVIVGIFMIISNSKKILSKTFLAYTFAGFIILIGVSFLFNNFLLIRFEEILKINQLAYNTETSTGIRSILWRTSLSLSFDSPIFGYGLGSVQNLIDARLIENGYRELTLILRYNAHNQFLQIALISGYLGLLFFLSVLMYIFHEIKKSQPGLCVFIYIVFCFIFESLLERQNGIIITALFFNLFLFLPHKKELINA